MLFRSILVRARPGLLSRTVPSSAGRTARQTRQYTDKDDSPSESSDKTKGSQANDTGSEKTEQPPKLPSLSSLIDNLNLNRAQSSESQLAARKRENLQELLSGSDSPLRGDGFGSRGPRFRGGQAANHMSEEDRNPMSKLILHVHASSNNTIMSLTDAKGRVIVNASGGSVGFKKAQRAGFEAAYQAAASIVNTVIEKNITVVKIELRLKGFGTGRDASFKAITSLTNWPVFRIVDTTPVPFNGCRPKKARRL
ncbi:hypothetical protein EV175_003861 [Coemansia sp. RSA 1933]|nr:hypothetical protein EV175_003861 [Coemansia sp. RSA 1933]